MKKTICAFLAIVMCMALAIPVFADDDIASGTQYTGKIQTPTIKVTAGTTNAVILNPYLIKITKQSVLSGDLSITSGDNFATTPSVVSPTLVLTNESNVPIKMSLSVTGQIPQGSTAKFLTSDTTSTDKTHGVFMFVSVTNVGSKADANKPTASDGLTTPPQYAASSVYSTSNTSGTQAVVKAGEVKMTDFTTLAVPASGEKGYVSIDIGGACSTTPTTAWASTDTVDVKLAFTFTATNNTTSS